MKLPNVLLLQGCNESTMGLAFLSKCHFGAPCRTGLVRWPDSRLSSATHGLSRVGWGEAKGEGRHEGDYHRM